MGKGQNYTKAKRSSSEGRQVEVLIPPKGQRAAIEENNKQKGGKERGLFEFLSRNRI